MVLQFNLNPYMYDHPKFVFNSVIRYYVIPTYVISSYMTIIYFHCGHHLYQASLPFRISCV